MSFLAPGALWALLALAVPIALHLRRRRVGRTVPVGSIRHLEPLPTAERRGLRLRDRRLLLLRALIVTLLALLLARPVVPRWAKEGRPYIIADSLTPPSVIGSLSGVGQVHLERLDDPWRRIQDLDDSLPAGTDLLVAASGRSDLYQGPRPVAARIVALYPNAAPRDPRPSAPGGPDLADLSAVERKALAAAVAAANELVGPLTDSAGWTRRLPSWWRDSIATPAFPVAVTRAVAPAKAGIPPTMLTEWQLRPRTDRGRARPDAVLDLHWWLWGAALLLFLLERAVTTRWRGPA